MSRQASLWGSSSGLRKQSEKKKTRGEMQSFRNGGGRFVSFTSHPPLSFNNTQTICTCLLLSLYFVSQVSALPSFFSCHLKIEGGSYWQTAASVEEEVAKRKTRLWGGRTWGREIWMKCPSITFLNLSDCERLFFLSVETFGCSFSCISTPLSLACFLLLPFLSSSPRIGPLCLGGIYTLAIPLLCHWHWKHVGASVSFIES